MTELSSDELLNLTVKRTLAGLAIRPLTQHFVSRLLWDLPLTPPQLVDFGIDSKDHYRALRAALINDNPNGEVQDQDGYKRELRKRVIELDKAYGNGPKLTALVKKYAPEYGAVVFTTSWDVLAGRIIEEKSTV